MNELPETHTLARQIQSEVIGHTITRVTAAHSPHKFAWYHGDPGDYPGRLMDNTILSAQAYGMMVEITLSSATLLFSDGIKLRLHPDAGSIPKKHQLLLNLNDGRSLSASLAMYGGLFCWENGSEFDNPYYEIARKKPDPLTQAFNQNYFQGLIAPEEVQKLSLKAVLATEQRIPGLGNGTLQDILWQAEMHPRRKLNTLSEDELETLFSSVKDTLAEMTRLGGRSTEKDLYGKAGGYKVVMCAANKGQPCPRCGAEILKTSYMGGSVYTCPTCQPL